MNTDKLLDEALERVYQKIDTSCEVKSWWWDMKNVWLPMGMIPYRSLTKSNKSFHRVIKSKGTMLIQINTE
jgi:hypothetical protein